MQAITTGWDFFQNEILGMQWLVDATLAATSKGVELLEEELGCVAAGKGTPAPDEEKPKNQTNPFL